MTPTNEQTRLEAFQIFSQLYTFVFDVPAVLRGHKPLSALVGLPELAGLLGFVGLSVLALDRYNVVLRQLASTIYLRDLAQFKRQILQGALWSALYSASLLLSKAVYLRISALWRNALTRHVQTRYVRSKAYYTQRPGVSANVISDPDQRISDDVWKTSQMMAAQFYKFVSTTSNGIQAMIRLSLSVNPRYVLFSISYLLATQKLREIMVPAMRLSRLNAATSKATGEYSSAFRRLVSSSEPIVTLGGTAGERRRILDIYSRLEQTQSEMLAETTKDTTWWYSAPMVTLQPLFMQLLVELPFVLSARGGALSGLDYASTQQGMAANAQVLGEMTFATTLVDRMLKSVRVMMIMPRQLLSAAGTGARVVELLSACDELGSNAGGSELTCDTSPSQASLPSISLDDFSVHSPAGRVLVRELTLRINQGQNLLIVGANGVGKTSLFRAMSGLWPSEGHVTLPGRCTRNVAHRPGMMFLPQRPYCPRGSLSDILTYPRPKSKASKITNESMRALLVAVDLEYLLDDISGRPSAIGNETDSSENLSLGEMQRLALARLLYHRPMFAVPAPISKFNVFLDTFQGAFLNTMFDGAGA